MADETGGKKPIVLLVHGTFADDESHESALLSARTRIACKALDENGWADGFWKLLRIWWPSS